MEIIIRTDEQGRPGAVDIAGTPTAGSVTEPPPAVATQAAAIGAYNAGPAPVGPGEASGPSEHVASEIATVSESSSLSAGEAPTD